MNRINYCLVKRNNFNEEIHDMLNEERLNMHIYDQASQIQYEIEKIISRASYIKISEEFNDNDEMIKDMIDNILEFDEKGADVYERNADNVLVVRNENIKYTIFFFIKKESDNNKELNDLCTLINMETIPLYDSCAIIKTNQKCENKTRNGELITRDDIKYLAKMLYYHKGVMIEEDGKITELEYFGDNPLYRIGNMFDHNAREKEVYDKVIRFYSETKQSEVINQKASKLIGEVITGRVFMIMLSDNSNKFWDFTEDVVNEIFKLYDNEISQEEKNLSKLYS